VAEPKPCTERRSETVIYLNYVWALFRPGHPVRVFCAHNIEPGPLEAWDVDDKKLLIEEGRRQLDRQLVDLHQIQARAQIVLTAGLLLTGGLSATLPAITSAPTGRGVGAFLLWVGATIALLFAILGSAAVIVVRVDFRAIDATLLSRVQPPVLDSLAAAYARSVRTGGNTIATRLSVLRTSVVVLLVGTAVFGMAWWTAVLA
jgi:hypothetical protein